MAPYIEDLQECALFAHPLHSQRVTAPCIMPQSGSLLSHDKRSIKPANAIKLCAIHVYGINSHEGSFTAERKYVRTHANVPISRDVPPRLNQQSSRSYIRFLVDILFRFSFFFLLVFRSPLESLAKKAIAYRIGPPSRRDATRTGSKSKRNAAKLSNRPGTRTLKG